mmetsp:Transcript_30611/g.78135  ORF Transcript_30611/g.78135 Transcript_30611/m.78135 type:complete len:95 (+) Transcript_30611:385-669(+)
MNGHNGARGSGRQPPAYASAVRMCQPRHEQCVAWQLVVCILCVLSSRHDRMVLPASMHFHLSDAVLSCAAACASAWSRAGQDGHRLSSAAALTV